MTPLLLGVLALFLCAVPPAVVWYFAHRSDRHVLGHSDRTHRMLSEHLGNDVLDHYTERKQ